jgi:hypothetical protein
MGQPLCLYSITLVYGAKTGNKDILHYLDDFLFGAEADSPKCQFRLQSFRDICKLCGVPVAEGKTRVDRNLDFDTRIL